MTDIVDSQTRSRMMAGIKSKNTKPEMLVRSHLHGRGLRFRLHRKDLPGKPDLIFPGRKIALFVHGCFWHRHEGCPKATTPASNALFWEKKFRDNVSRDKRVRNELERLGWKVLVIWECQLNSEKLDELADAILKSGPKKHTGFSNSDAFETALNTTQNIPVKVSKSLKEADCGD